MTEPPRLPASVLARIAIVICGNWGDGHALLSQYRTARELDDFFVCDLGLDTSDVAGGSRGSWTEGLLKKFNGTQDLVRIIEAAVRPAHYVDIDGQCTGAVEYLNATLVTCGLRIEPYGRGYRLVHDDGTYAVPVPETDLVSAGYVRELSQKCEGRLREADYDGAITLARTLVESVLVEIEQQLTGKRTDHQRDLQGQFTVVRKLLRIDEERADLDASFKTMIKGLVQVVNGLAPLRNKMGDGHARERKPAPHHARFVVNAAKTVAFFLVESYAYQRDAGRLQPLAEEYGGQA